MPYEQKSEDDESNSDENVLNSSTDTIIFFQTKIKNEVNDDDDDVEVIEIPPTSFQLQISEVVSLASTDTQELEQQWNDDTTSNGKFFLKIILKIKLKINL